MLCGVSRRFYQLLAPQSKQQIGGDMAEDWREVVADWQGELGFIGRNPSGGSVQMGVVQGNPGVSPMEMLLLGVAGCTGMDVASILTKMRQNLIDLRVTVRGKRAEEHPRVYTEIEVLYELWGDELDPKMVSNAIELSEIKYCSASAMLKAAAKLQSSYLIHPVKQSISS
jgi:putative redox protein